MIRGCRRAGHRKVGAVIWLRIVQERDAVGVPAPMVFAEVVQRGNALGTWPDAVMRVLCAVSPSRTGRPGIYAYADPARGSGLLYVERASAFQLMRIDELVQMEEIERVVGKDPTRYEDTPGYLIPFVINLRNPYLQMALGALFLIPAAMMLLVPVPVLAPAVDLFTKIGIPVLGIVSGVLAVLVFLRGKRRRRWWHAARVEARRDGGRVPQALEVLW